MKAVTLPCLLAAFLSLMTCSLAMASTHTMQTPDPAVETALKKAVDHPDSFQDRFDAEVWLVDMSGRLSKYVPNPSKRLKLLKVVHEEATRAGLTPELVLAVIQVESLFDRFAISRVGAQGLMQVMPFWKKEIGRPNDNLTHIETNLRYGCTILKHYIDEENGNVMRGLARYNGSTGKVWYAERVMDAWQNRWYVNDQ